MTADTVNGVVSAPAERPREPTIRLPEFSPDDPELWFCMVESKFHCARITSELEKYNAVLSALSARYTREVRDLIVSVPTENPYTKLRNELIKRLGTSQEAKTLQLLEREVIGSRKPSQFLRDLRTLGGQALTDDMARGIWMSRLPMTVRAVLASHQHVGLNTLADIADSMLDAMGTQSQVSAVQTSSSYQAPARDDKTRALEMQISELRLEIAALRDNRARSDQRSRSRSRNRSQTPARQHTSNEQYYWYHQTFGPAARKCTAPCAFAGNGAGTR